MERLRAAIEDSDAILIGAGAGLSTAAGLSYSGERFQKYFSDFARKYGIRDMYSGGFYPFETAEEYWAWWSRHILVNRYDAPVGQPYSDLCRLMRGRDYFVLTTNVDHQFQRADFDKRRLFYMQGDYGLWQCAKACHDRVYDNESQVRLMAARQKDMRVPSELLPRCPVCGAPMTMNLRVDDRFVQDAGWRRANECYQRFVQEHRNRRILLLELGVGFNTPDIIKFPFWQMAAENPKARYVCVNSSEVFCPQVIEKRSICIEGDVREVLLWIQKSSPT